MTRISSRFLTGAVLSLLLAGGSVRAQDPPAQLKIHHQVIQSQARLERSYRNACKELRNIRKIREEAAKPDALAHEMAKCDTGIARGTR